MSERKKAWECLIQIIKDGKYSNLVLRHELDQMESGSKALVTQIVYGTLQNYRLVRYQWEADVTHMPIGEIAILLDMSVYQLLYMKQADYAVLDEAVQLSKRIKGGKFSALVNAVLRKVQKRKERPLPGDEWKRLGIVTSHPDWLISMWKSQYGEAVCKAVCEHDQLVSMQAIRVNRLKITEDAFLKQVEGFEKHPKLPEVLLAVKGTTLNREAFEKGLYSMQNASSQLITPFLNPQPHDHILDICAAPGTKTCHIAEWMQDQGSIIACDLHEHRVKLIEEGTQRLGITCVETKCCDGTHADELFAESEFDRILIDAPCTGYGTLQGKSDIRLRMKSEDMDAIITIQKNILDACSGLLKQQGTLVYSTCTLNKKENEKQIESFLKRHEDYELIELRTVFPDEYDSDGFFMAKLTRH